MPQCLYCSTILPSPNRTVCNRCIGTKLERDISPWVEAVVAILSPEELAETMMDIAEAVAGLPEEFEVITHELTETEWEGPRVLWVDTLPPLAAQVKEAAEKWRQRRRRHQRFAAFTKRAPIAGFIAFMAIVISGREWHRQYLLKQFGFDVLTENFVPGRTTPPAGEEVVLAWSHMNHALYERTYWSGLLSDL